jgi:hypothetical protein
VAAEARGVVLHERTAAEFPHIALAETRGLGRATWKPEEEARIEAGRG